MAQRAAALSYRKVAREGGDPFATRREARKVVPTFQAAAETVHSEHEVSWKNPKHAKQWINTLTQYASDYRRLSGRCDRNPRRAQSALAHLVDQA